MIKFKLFANFTKEEAWLEKMAKKGYLLTQKDLFYHFTKTQATNAVIRIDYREFKTAADYTDYGTLFADSGWQLMAGSRHSGKQYFLKTSHSASNDIFSDATSRLARYKVVYQAWSTVTITLLPLFVVIYLQPDNAINLGQFGLKQWYYTPGLWSLTGAEFWGKFLFETPFAIMRGYGWLILLLFFLASAIITIVYGWHYRAQCKKEGG
ncbi:DUF2812 domain-containing protein [Ruminococcaceae bacterium OttesenSCG-928-A16]|nr:DUF2812 domain-containing protein [Ruminococcaceae bacterium OttesenSCG-928-A16]